MNPSIEIVKPRIQRPQIYFVSLTIYFLISCIAFSLDNIFLKISVPIVLLLIIARYSDKFLFSKNIGSLILLDNSIEIIFKDNSERIELKDLSRVSINRALMDPLTIRKLPQCPTLLLTLYYGNKKNKIYLSNNQTNFKLIDEYLEKLNRMGIKLQ